jgi:acylphosphatase
VVVGGRVQGVFYRESCRSEAARRGVTGWVANRDDGSVEAVFEGDPAAVDALVEWCRSGSPRAQVSRFEMFEEDPQGERGFRVV